MTNTKNSVHSSDRTIFHVIVGTIVVSLFVGWLGWSRTLTASLHDTARRGDNVLQLATTGLEGQLARFERLPSLIADQTVIRALVLNPESPSLIDQANRYLERIQGQLGASDIYLMNESGTTIAASNFRKENSFIGGNFSFRPYFYDAMRGGTGRFYAIGTTSRKRGYYFGAPVTYSGKPIGVLAIKIDLDTIEQSWRGGDYVVLVTDPDGIVFLSSRTDWLFKALEPLSAAASARNATTQRYATATIGLLNAVQMPSDSDRTLVRVENPDGSREYLVRNFTMIPAGWQVHVWVDTAPAQRSALVNGALALLAMALVAMGGILIWQHRQGLADRLALQATARRELEQRVEERTSELRKTQNELIQAGKLAALGQMSAALSHEFNQPLAAARTYADNAIILMDRGRQDEARGNLDRILGLIDRMTSISKHLRSFARAPGQKLTHLSVAETVEAALEIASLRLRSVEANLTLQIPHDLPMVIGGPVRLQQVLVNLLTNAADAVEGRDQRDISLTAHQAGDHVILRIVDTGPGVPDSIAARIFDPFFSTKGVGGGLGLGLSISYNIIKDFGGELTVGRSSGAGAMFEITLKVAPTASTELEAAE